jgi:anti-sigma regulatory factor (Ser/Thr protein kinase)
MEVKTAITKSVSITEPSQVGEARRIAVSMSHAAGLNEIKRGEVGIVVTEAASNIIKHARQGELLLRLIHENGAAGIEMLALDKGAGMGEIRRCIEDGYSTAGSPGTGLGAVARLSSSFNVFSPSNLGTALMSRLVNGANGASTPKAYSRPQIELGAVCVPFEGEKRCGDAWAMVQVPDWTKIIVVDGLGHGTLASEAAQEGIRIFGEHAGATPAELLKKIHEALFKTRGAAVAVANIEHSKERVTFAGVGNIACRVIDPGGPRSMISHDGIAGHMLSRVREYQQPWSADSVLVMHSDGVSTRWDISHYPGLIRQHPSIMAGVIYRDFQRTRDDATIVVAREPMTD